MTDYEPNFVILTYEDLLLLELIYTIRQEIARQRRIAVLLDQLADTMEELYELGFPY